MFRDVHIAAAAHGLKVGEAVREALREYCDKHSKKVDNIKRNTGRIPEIKTAQMWRHPDGE